MTAKEFIEELARFKSKIELNKVGKFFKGDDGKTKDFGVKFGDVFKLAKVSRVCLCLKSTSFLIVTITKKDAQKARAFHACVSV